MLKVQFIRVLSEAENFQNWQQWSNNSFDIVTSVCCAAEVSTEVSSANTNSPDSWLHC